MGENLYLRAANADDFMLLYKWANDQTVRQNSYHSEPITIEEHKRWFERKLADANCDIYILTDGLQDYGQVRGEREESVIKIGYSIDASFRGKGYAKTMLKLFAEKYRGSLLYAEVKEENTASQRVFEDLGYRKEVVDGHIQYTMGKIQEKRRCHDGF